MYVQTMKALREKITARSRHETKPRNVVADSARLLDALAAAAVASLLLRALAVLAAAVIASLLLAGAGIATILFFKVAASI